MFGMALTRPSLTMQFRSGMDIFAHACGQTADFKNSFTAGKPGKSATF